jgi:starch synthase (maltosyl-transferring)
VRRVVVRLGIVRTPNKGGPTAFAFRKYVDALLVNSAAIRAEWLRTVKWFPPSRIHLVLNAIAPADVDRAAARALLRAELGIADHQFIAVAVGHVAHRKGFDLLLHSLEGDEARDWVAVLVGDGPTRPQLEELTDQLGLTTRVHWLGRREDVPRIVGGADVFTLCSRNEGMANVMLESMATGTPVIATDVSGVREAIGQAPGRGVAGWVIPPEDPDALRRALADVRYDLLTGGMEVGRRTDEGSWRVREWFRLDRMLDEAERVLFAAAAPR